MVQQPLRVNQTCLLWGAALQHHHARHAWRMHCLIGKYIPGAVMHSDMSMHCPLSASCDDTTTTAALQHLPCNTCPTGPIAWRHGPT